MGEAVGIVELFGLVAAFAAADAGCKAADVRLEPFDKNKPANADALPVPLIVAVKFRGSVTAVEAAVEAAVKQVLKEGFRTIDIMPQENAMGESGQAEVTQVGTAQMGDLICGHIGA